MLDKVVFTTVSQTPNVEGIQGEIADLLGITISEESEVGRARRLSMRSQSGEKILVILDDVWEKLDLEDIRFPLYSHLKDHLNYTSSTIMYFDDC
ncbi:disease resistance protein [Senna tora]|uniref:Disease resistance protein n=1 Tax=Senna tora TaxID=362788 RepID=A0A834T4Z9_9FABA|nr:disease resistance protein [Senna tora]